MGFQISNGKLNPIAHFSGGKGSWMGETHPKGASQCHISSFGLSSGKNKLLILMARSWSISRALKFEKLAMLWGNIGKILLRGVPSVPSTSLSARCLNTGTFEIVVPIRI